MAGIQDILAAEDQTPSLPMQDIGPELDEQKSPVAPLAVDDILTQAMDLTKDITNPNTGEMNPDYADGISPETPTNQSPVSTADRLKLSAGDLAGGINFLKEKYEDVVVNKSGDLVVKEGDRWHRVDPEGLGDVDPWKVTNDIMNGKFGSLQNVATEAMNDVADFAPELALVGTSAGLAALTGGTSLIAQAAMQGGAGAAVAIINSQLGKWGGTYKGTLEEQLQEGAFEGLINIAGIGLVPAAGGIIKIAKGAKKFFPTAKSGEAIGEALADSALELHKTTQPGVTREVAEELFGAMTAAGPARMARLLERAPKLAPMLKKASNIGRGSQIQEAMKTANIADFASLAKETRGALTKSYGKALNEVAKNVPEDILINVAEVPTRILKNFSKSGLLKQTKSGAVVLKPSNELLSMAQKIGQPDSLVELLATQPKFRGIFDSYVKELSIMATKAAGRGRKAFDQIVNFERKRQDMLRLGTTRGFADGFGARAGQELKKLDDIMEGMLDSVVESRLGSGTKLFKEYAAAKGSYRQKVQATAELLDLADKINAGKATASTIEAGLNKFVAGPGKSVGFKGSVKGAVEELGEIAPSLKKLTDDILDRDTVQAFVPRVRGQMLQFSPLSVVPAVAGAALGGRDGSAGGAVTGAVAGGVGAALLTSPRAVGKAALTLARTQQLNTQAGAAATKKLSTFLKTLSDSSRKALLSSDAGMTALRETILRQPQIRDESLQQLRNIFEQKTQEAQ